MFVFKIFFLKYIFTIGMYMNIKIQDILKKKYLKYKNKVKIF